MTTTINAYSVGLGLDASEYIRNSNLSRKETAALKREINSARTPAENYQRKFEMLTKALDAGAIEQETFNRLLEEAHNKLLKAQAAEKKLTASTDKLTDSQKKLTSAQVASNVSSEKMVRSQRTLGDMLRSNKAAFLGLVAAGAGVTAMMVRLAKASVGYAADLEVQQIQFRNLIGSATEAQDVMATIRDFTATTPFQVSDVSRAARTLLTFGTATQDLQRELRILGNVSAGTGANLNDIATILGRARGSFSVSLEDVNRLADRGIDMYGLLSERLGVTEKAIRKMASTGKLEASDLFAVFKALGAEGGKFSTSTRELSETYSGLTSTLSDNVIQLKTSFGRTLMPTLKDVNRELTSLVQGFNQAGVAADRLSKNSTIGRLAKLVDFSRDWEKLLGGFTDGAMAKLKDAEEQNLKALIAYQKRLKALRAAGDPRARGLLLPGEKQPLVEDKARTRQIEKRKLAEEKVNNQLANRVKRQEDLRKQVEQAKERERALNKRIASERMNLQKQWASIQAAELKDFRRRALEIRDAVAQGPGSFSEGDDIAFLARQQNQRIAIAAARNAIRSGDVRIKKNIDDRKTADEKLAEIKKLAEQAGVERRKTNDLLRQVADSAPKRIR